MAKGRLSSTAQKLWTGRGERPRPNLDDQVPFVEYQLGRDLICLDKSHWPTQRRPRPPVIADLSQYVRARHTRAQSEDQPLVVPCSQSSLQPTAITHAERQLGRVEIFAPVPNRAVGRAVDNQTGKHGASMVAGLKDAWFNSRSSSSSANASVAVVGGTAGTNLGRQR